MNLLLPIHTQTRSCKHVRYAAAVWIGTYKSCSWSRQVELGDFRRTCTETEYLCLASNFKGKQISLCHLVNYVIASRLHVKDHQPAPSSVSWLYKTLNQQQIIKVHNKSNSLGFWNMPTSRLHNMQYVKRVGCSDTVSLSLQADTTVVLDFTLDIL